LFSVKKIKKTQQHISPSISVLFKLISAVICEKILEFDGNKNFESATI